ncbi:putative fad binding protein [Diaporthe ampelina]|uniref:Putative fad binding protein n=1 Tax=Diaporthe ampelina TaxID=1214573 RepID=A0A0G2FG24_9PEZI|nr:putative fad binding protein [Diaporthe ampelina]
MYWAFASVRGILPGGLEEEQLMLPIAPAFKKYSSDKFEFVVGKAEQLQPSSNSVTIQTNQGAVRQIEYHTLVIATGTSAREEMPFKTVNTTEQTKDVLHDWQQRIESAKSVVVGGAGMTGIELAGELAEAYAKTGQKKVTLIGSSDLPLDATARKDVRQAAKKSLEKLGAQVKLNAKVTKVEGPEDGSKTISLSLGQGGDESIEADVYIPTYGLLPNSDFVPANLLDHRRHVKQTKHLRAEGHDNIFVVGDVGSLETPQGIHTETQVLHVVKNLQAYLKGEALTEYAFSTDPLFMASLGKNGGIGQAKGWKLFSFMVKMFKAQTLGTQNFPGILAGQKTMTKGKWA